MAIQIIKENTNISLINTVDNSKIATFDLYTFTFAEQDTDVYLISDVSSAALVSTADAVDDNGDAFADSGELIAYLENTSREGPNMGTSLRLDNIELSNTGAHLKMVNVNTQEETFMVQQRVDPNLGTTSVYYVEQTTEVQHETSTDAYQPYSVHSGKGALNAQGRYALALDISVIQDTFVHEYRSILNTNIENLNIKIFSVTQTPANLSEYRELAGTDIVTGWYISKRPYWTLNKQATIDTKAGQSIASGNAALPFVEGFSLKSGGFYRFVISGDNDFEFQGVNGVPNPFGGTQFIPYIERSFTGEVEVNVKTEGAKTHTTAIDFSRDATNTTVIISDGETYAVNTIKAVEDNGTIRIVTVDATGNIVKYKQINHELVTIAGGAVGSTVTGVVNALNSLFAVQPLNTGSDFVGTTATLAPVDVATNFAEGTVPANGSIYQAGLPSTHGARVWSDETIDAVGEFFDVEITGVGQFAIGLYSVEDGHLADITQDNGQDSTGYKWAQGFYNYGTHVAPYAVFGSNALHAQSIGWNGLDTEKLENNLTIQTKLQGKDPSAPAYFRIAINAQGYIAVYYFDEGRSNQYIMTARSTYTVDSGNYGLMVKLISGEVQLATTPSRNAVDEAAPVLAYNYIESPDGVFTYPLFATEEEANYVDGLNGGSSTNHSHTFVDDVQAGRVWYMPDTGGSMNVGIAPTNTAEITYNEIATLDDALFAPTPFSNQTITVNEGELVNLQIMPAGASWTTSIGGIPAWSYSNGYLQGTAPQVDGNNVDNPFDTTTVTIYRTNDYGTSQGTLTINITNLTAPTVTISGFTHVAGSTAMIDSDTLAAGSYVTIDDNLENFKRLVINRDWINNNVLPKLAAGTGITKVWIGIPKAGADFTDGVVDGTKFDFAHQWFVDDTRRANNTHRYRIWNGTDTPVNNTISSSTFALYDFVIDNKDGEIEFNASIASTSTSTELRAEDGGTWSHTQTFSTATGTQTIYIAATNVECDLTTENLVEVNTPSAPATSNSITTTWDKALDFNGSNEYAGMTNTSYFYNTLDMSASGITVDRGTANLAQTSNATAARPWAVATVFKIDGNSSDQFIWCQHEGTNTNTEYIGLKVNAIRNVHFVWGREGSGANQYTLFDNMPPNTWYGVYIEHTGVRLSGSNATASNLMECFRFKLVDLQTGDVTTLELNTPSSYNTWVGTGQRMDRQMNGQHNIGGRGNNKSFKGTIASHVVTTLKRGQTLPSDPEVSMMVRDPKQWLLDYKVGNSYRQPHYQNATANFQLNNSYSAYGTQVWLMGDGTNDSYSNMIRNQVRPSDQNVTMLRMYNMQSNDIVNVNINGLSSGSQQTSTYLSYTGNLFEFTDNYYDGYTVNIASTDNWSVVLPNIASVSVGHEFTFTNTTSNSFVGSVVPYGSNTIDSTAGTHQVLGKVTIKLRKENSTNWEIVEEIQHETPVVDESVSGTTLTINEEYNGGAMHKQLNFTSVDTVVLNHNLGGIPIIQVWVEDGAGGYTDLSVDIDHDWTDKNTSTINLGSVTTGIIIYSFTN